jgi:hypothetical protein
MIGFAIRILDILRDPLRSQRLGVILFFFARHSHDEGTTSCVN